jgi:hypothetical protein
VSALNQSGLGASAAGGIDKDNFSVRGTLVTASGDNIQVFEYPSARIAAGEAKAFLESHLMSGAGGATPGAWERPVSLYAKGSLIIFYMGSNERIVEVLDTVAGPPLAGGRHAFSAEKRS